MPVAARARFVRTFFALSPILVDVVLDDGGEEKEKEEDDEVEGRGDDGEEAGEEERGIVDEEDCFRLTPEAVGDTREVRAAPCRREAVGGGEGVPLRVLDVEDGATRTCVVVAGPITTGRLCLCDDDSSLLALSEVELELR